MYRVLVLLLLLLPALPAAAQRRLPGWEPEPQPRTDFFPPPLPVRGPVAVMTVRDSALVAQPRPYRPSRLRRYYFDERGRIRRMLTLYPATGQPFAEVRYDAYGRIVRHSLVQENGYFEAYRYLDRQRRRLGFHCGPDSVVLDRTIDTFDRRGHLLRSEALNDKGQLTSSVSYRYDRRGQLVERLFRNTPLGNGLINALGPVTTFKPWPNDTLRYFTTYDRHQQPSSQAHYHNGKLQWLADYFSRGDTSWVRRVYLAGPVAPHHANIQEVGTVGTDRVERLHYLTTLNAPPGRLAHHIHWQYYHRDELLEWGYQADGVVQERWRYRYVDETDAWGNCRRRTYLANDAPHFLERRVLEYRPQPSGR